MPLAPPSPRRLLHTRSVRYECYAREDGRYDVDAHLVDVKDHDFTLLTGLRRSGHAVHDMWIRVTIDRELNVLEVSTKMDAMPYPGGCNRIEGAYAKLVGANLGVGFRKRVQAAMGGMQGCTHITECLGGVPTAAIQMFAGLRKREDDGATRPFQLDRCHALDTTGEVVRRYYPAWYREPVDAEKSS